MELRGDQTFVGFGFGPIQGGLFVLEAFLSGRFGRIVVGEVIPDVVRAVRGDGGRFSVNVAHHDRVEAVTLAPVELEDPAVPEDRGRLVQAIARASEIATAVPSVAYYQSDAPGSIHRLLAQGLSLRFGSSSAEGASPVVIYAAENHNHAAEILEERVLAEVLPRDRDRVRAGAQFLNTVVGKMSGTVPTPDPRGLVPVTSRASRAFLVERFNRILVSRIRFGADSGFRRGIEVFEEKPDLLPFEEAKLYGHNAAHALAAYAAQRLGLVRMEDLRRAEGAVDFVRAAFLEESGAALVKKWRGVDDLFTPEGYRAYVDDLIDRMLNPHLGDLVERVARDPVRKLGWEDRLVGTMRLVLAEGVIPRRFALGAAAALAALDPRALDDGEAVESRLDDIWVSSRPDPAERANVLRLVQEGLGALCDWRRTGTPPFAKGW
jgi:mannitol-1-phosphate 5-dehydrogenase